MSRLVLAVVLAVPLMRAQTYQQLLLSEARHIVGTVVDSEGRPVAEARVDHSDDRRHAHQTGPDGRFELTTRAPALVIRKAGFRSEWLRIQDSMPTQITLQELNQSGSFPFCSKRTRYVGLEGWGAVFQFPRVPGLSAGEQTNGIDAGDRSYYIKSNSGPKRIQHGSGPMWSFGMPRDEDVWRAVTYEEKSYELGRLTVIDARGKVRSGNFWRSLGKIGESASYSDVNAEAAQILDRVLDGACLKSTRRQ